MTAVKLFPMLAAGLPLALRALQILVGWMLPVLIPASAVAAAIYYVNRRPLRRQEDARFLLDLIESALQQGQSIEHHILSLAGSGDGSPGAQFHLLAAELEKGRGLIPALEKVPDLLLSSPFFGVPFLAATVRGCSGLVIPPALPKTVRREQS